MPDNGDAILSALKELQGQVHDVQLKSGDTNTKVAVIQQKVEAMEDRVVEHSQVLFGDPKRMGEGGLLHKQYVQDQDIDAVKKEIKSVRGRFATIWAVIMMAWSGALNVLLRKI